MASSSNNENPLNVLVSIQSKEGLQNILQLAFRHRNLFHTAFRDDEELSYTPSELYRMEQKKEKYLGPSNNGENSEKQRGGVLSWTDRLLIEVRFSFLPFLLPGIV